MNWIMILYARSNNQKDRERPRTVKSVMNKQQGDKHFEKRKLDMKRAFVGWDGMLNMTLVPD